MSLVRKSAASIGKAVAVRFSSSAAAIDPTQEKLLAERCILVDEEDNAVGEASKRECHLVDPKTGSSPLHRAFSLFVFNHR